MKIRAQIAMVLNLDKCIGCHTCSVTCKNVWTSRTGVEYAWFNNVETKPGVGFPREWENQKRWNGGWVRKADGRIEPRMGPKWRILAKIFGERMAKIERGPNWEEILGGEFEKRKADYNFEGVEAEIYGAFENTFM